MRNADPTPPPSERTTLKRRAGRGDHERATIHAILDEALICTVSFVRDGTPAAIPMAYCRKGEQIYLHGSTANRMLRSLRDGGETCVTVALLDGLVLARSAFHHSVNYRCVVIYACAREVSDPGEKLAALEATVEHLVPGRWRDVRKPTQEEMRSTLVLSLPIDEASAKVRTGPPIDDAEDLAFATWAGVVPLRQVADEPVADAPQSTRISTPTYASEYDDARRRRIGQRHTSRC
jgi:nitroimidazol reductase NimA-like FMN-containing flavoprotein (pyridoxamine 5'-phosphate oxidase superfamily)